MLSTESSPKENRTGEYDPFVRGEFPVGVRTIQALDAARDRVFPCEIWSPEKSGPFPLILFSHHSGGHRRAATFLCTHLCSHGYVVAAMDHPPEQVLANRVPELRFLLDQTLSHTEWNIDSTRIGIVGHSLGGWTVLATPEVEPRIRAVVALAPGGSSNPKPGIIRANLTFEWGRDVPTLYLAAENDVPIPLDGIYELFERTRATKQLVILRRADHLHFMDNVEEIHETARATPFTGELAWIPKAMRPFAELCSEEQAHLFVRGLTLCHMDAVLRQQNEARRFLAGGLAAELAARGVEVLEHTIGVE